MVDNYLEHYGKKGMRWGIRKTNVSRASIGTRNYNPSKLSNKDLNKVIKRMELEQKYTELNKKASIKGKGLDAAKRFLSKNGDKAIGALVTGVATAAVAAFLKSPKAQIQLAKLAKIA